MTADSEIPALICELCRHFYGLGWVSGTGGGISIRGEAGIYMAPSGVQKERIRPEDVFLLDASDLTRCRVLRPAADPSLRVSECQPLFYHAYRLRGAGAVIHSHSVHAVLAARMAAPDGGFGVFESRNLEMHKGLRGKGAFDTVRVPVIPNTAREAELADTLEAAMLEHPDVDAVLVSGHGFYVWGETWQRAKTYAECFDYLFQTAVLAKMAGLDAPGAQS